MRCWHGYLSGVGAVDLHVVQLMLLPPHHLCFSKIHNGLSFWCHLTWVEVDSGQSHKTVVQGVYKSSLTNFQDTFNKFPVDIFTLIEPR